MGYRLLYAHNSFFIPESFNTNISHLFFSCKKANLKDDFVLKKKWLPFDKVFGGSFLEP